MPENEKKNLERMLKDGLTGRQALLRAYETVGDRVRDPETKAMLHRFTQEEKQEYEEAEAISRRYGVEPGAFQEIRGEVMALLSKTVLRGGEPPYSDARDLTMLYGAEAAGKLGTKPIQALAERLGDADWARAAKTSEERAATHLDYLEGRVHTLSGSAFNLGHR